LARSRHEHLSLRRARLEPLSATLITHTATISYSILVDPWILGTPINQTVSPPWPIALDPPLFSEGWLSRFAERHSIRYHTFYGESASVPTSIHTEMEAIRAICDRYQPHYIYNMDETGLFWRRMPIGGLSSKGSPGYKKDKTRITLTVTTNATGSDRMPLRLIGTAKTPRALRKLNISSTDASGDGIRTHGCAATLCKNGFARSIGILAHKDELFRYWITSVPICLRSIIRRHRLISKSFFAIKLNLDLPAIKPRHYPKS
jgi:hypothetical protein